MAFFRFVLVLSFNFFIHLAPHRVYAQASVKLAFISDIHLHNIYPTADTARLTDFYDHKRKQYVLIRSLAAELNSTRLFNENYFALEQALSEMARKGIQLVVIPGDLTDDGQLLNIAWIKEVLLSFQEKYSIRFLIINGNHDADPKPAESGKKDFLSLNGAEVGVYSSPVLAKKETDYVYPPLKAGGYEVLFDALKSFGLQPDKADLFYTTPHHTFNYDQYVFDTNRFAFNTRLYPYQNNLLPDLTYLSEPVKDLWVMGIDGNVFAPASAEAYDNIGDAYRFIDQKPFMLPWIRQVVAEAKKRGKTLIAFGHYPMLDFNNGQSAALRRLVGEKKFQLNRVPPDRIQDVLQKTGLQLYFAGHMHINQHGYRRSTDGSTLWNIQVPSLAAFPPAYKIARIRKNRIRLRTHVLKKVKQFDRLFPYYQLEKNGQAYEDITRKSHHYFQFTQQHLFHLATSRFYDNDFNAPQWAPFKTATPRAWMQDSIWQSLSGREQQTLASLLFRDIIFDFCLIRNGNDLGLKQIKHRRMRLYRSWAQAAEAAPGHKTCLDDLIITLVQLVENSNKTARQNIILSR